jgi:hypothetical protein
MSQKSRKTASFFSLLFVIYVSMTEYFWTLIYFPSMPGTTCLTHTLKDFSTHQKSTIIAQLI